MAKVNQSILGFNSGEISIEALTRVDLERVRFGAEVMTNWLPRSIGSRFVRPGMAYLGAPAALPQFIPFVFNAIDTALLELTDDTMRVWIDDALLTRPSVTSTITNGDFTSNLNGWTDDDESGADSFWLGGYMLLQGTGFNFARRTQEVTVSGGNIGVEHAVRVNVYNGPVLFRIGSTAGGEEYIRETVLRAGVHSLAFTPTGNFHISVYSSAPSIKRVESITLEAAGAVSIPTPWQTDDIGNIRHDQSGDVIFCASGTRRQQRIERRSARSWSVCDYAPEDGPFRTPNLSPITMTPSDVTGEITVTSSRAFFEAGHRNALLQFTHLGQTATSTLGGGDQFTSEIRVTGATSFASTSRQFTVQITGTWTGTITLQRSFGSPGAWVDFQNYTGNQNIIINDTFTNEIVYYRLGFKTGNYGSGSAIASLIYSNSAQTGVVKINQVVSSTSVVCEVLRTLGKAEATSDWREGEWSDRRGFPTSVALHDGRLVWGWRDRVFGSVSDAYESFDQQIEGDSGPIIRSVASGPADSLYWMKSLIRLLAGGPSQEVSIRSSSFDEPLTPTQFTAKRCSARGSKNIDSVVVDNSLAFVQRDGRRLMELSYTVEAQDYTARDLSRLNPLILQSGIVSMAVQRQPETRVWCILEKGTAAVLTYEKNDGVIAWTPIERVGNIRAICVLPGADEDQVYFCIDRGGTLSVEKLAKESECIGGTLNKIADSHVVYTGTATTTIPVGSHLNGQQVVVWANGVAIHDQDNMPTVSGGNVTIASARTNVVVGLPYTARYQSMKLAFAAELGTALVQRKRVDHLGVILRNTAWKGYKIGRDFDNLRSISKMRQGKEVPDNEVFDYYDYDATSFAGSFDTDSRVCDEVKAPYPATVIGLVVGMTTNEKGMPERAAA